MHSTTLGRTNLVVSIAGLGCGGHARLGQAYGHSTQQSVDLIHSALDQGVNFLDTAAVYGTEEIVGTAIKGRRDQVVISTKQTIVQPGTSALGQAFLSAEQFCRRVEENLTRLGTDTIDVLHLHGVMADQYHHCVEVLAPALMSLRDQGKIRFLGITERFIRDTKHQMLDRALQDEIWDVVMLGFNLINPSARGQILHQTRANKVGTLNMFAVRRALSNVAATAEIIDELRQSGQIQLSDQQAENPLAMLTEPHVAHSVTEAAYRFCRHEPGIDVVLTGTGSEAHLSENLAALQMPPLPVATQDRLRAIFGNVDSVSGN